jgi:hypothetical protein
VCSRGSLMPEPFDQLSDLEGRLLTDIRVKVAVRG